MRLELRDVHHVYAAGTPFEVEALRGVSLVVEQGEVLGIVGGTGSGKSTLVRHMNLLLVPTSGEVLVDGVDATTLRKSELRRRVGLVFQFPEAALFAPTVEEDVAFAPRRLGLDGERSQGARARVVAVARGRGSGGAFAVRPLRRREAARRHRRGARDGARGTRPRRADGGPRPRHQGGVAGPDPAPARRGRLGRPRLPRPRRGGRGRRPGVRARTRAGYAPSGPLRRCSTGIPRWPPRR